MFWLDSWLGNRSLAEAFPPIFNLVINQEEFIHDVLSRRANTHVWDFQLRRRLFDWEKGMLDEFLSILDGSEFLLSDGSEILLSNGSEDTLTRLDNCSLSFSVKSLYNLANPSSSDSTSKFAFIWKNLAPYRVQCFIWLVIHGRVKTADYLFNIGIIQSAEESLCKFYSMHIESLDHLFLHCVPVWILWSNVLSWWGVKWVTPPSATYLISWWKDWKLKKVKRKIWVLIPMAVIWTVWKLRNACVFDRAVTDWDKSAEIVKIRVALWVKSDAGIKDFSIDDFLFRLNSILDSL